MAVYEAQGIVCGIGAQLLCLTKDVMSEGMSCKEDILEFIVDQFGR